MTPPPSRSDYHYLCANCGEIRPADNWATFHYTEDGRRRPPRRNETDPVLECPVCFHNHIDDDAGPGMYDGTRDECVSQRQQLLNEYFDQHGYDWGEQWTAVRADIASGKIVPWEDPSRSLLAGAIASATSREEV